MPPEMSDGVKLTPVKADGVMVNVAVTGKLFTDAEIVATTVLVTVVVVIVKVADVAPG